MKKLFICSLILGTSMFTNAQQTKKVLFIGNSYTSVNNLPNLVDLVAQSVGDDIEYSAHTPGGNTLMNHAQNTSLAQTIITEDWDYVTIQAQSQEPSFPTSQFTAETLPYANQLVDAIKNNNACTEPVFYMTWGRENGDAGNCPFAPWVCTYEGMDDSLRARYEYMAEVNESLVSPVGAVWRELRTNGIPFNLYTGDGSHPSIYGSYTAALTFYTILFKNDPTLITYVPGGISAADATTIKNATKTIVYNNLPQWNVGAYTAQADFTFVVDSNTVNFTNTSSYSESYEWIFADNSTSTDEDVSFEFANNGDYDIQLIATGNCGETDTITQTVTIQSLGVKESPIYTHFYPNPVKSVLNIGITDPTLNYHIDIYNMQGQVVKGFDNISTINVSDLKSGEYIIKINNQTSSSVTKFVKQ